MGARAKITTRRFNKAAPGTYGSLSAIARRLEVSRTTVYKFLEKNPDCKALLEEMREEFDDTIEALLRKDAIEDPEYRWRYARTKLRNRGYGEKIEQDINVNKIPELTITLTDTPKQK